VQGELVDRDFRTFLVIAVLGLVATVICFGILSSKAEGGGGAYSGAIAGAAIAWAALGALYAQIRKLSRTEDDLRKANEELRTKLIRGTTPPEGFRVEMDDLNRLVFARPGSWERGAKKLFEFSAPADKLEKDDFFPATLTVQYVPDVSRPSDEFFRDLEHNFAEYAHEVEAKYSTEVVYLGEGEHREKSLKFVAQTYARVTVGPDPFTKRRRYDWSYVSLGTVVNHWWVAFERVLYERQTGLGGLRSAAEQKQAAWPLLLAAVREWRLDAPRRLSAVVEPVLAGILANGEGDGKGPVGNGAGQEAAGPRDDEGRGRSATEAVAGTSELAQGESMTDFVPVRRIFLACHHRRLETAYFFDFADDEADFTASSEQFNQILGSVRFLP
jgi:hypothetical protein